MTARTLKARRMIYLALGALAVAGLLAWAFMPSPLPVDTGIASTGTFEASLEDDGRTRLRNRFVVSAPLAGHLARISLREGDSIEAGMPVAVITPALPPLLDDRVLQAQRARVESAQASLERGQARIARSEVAVEQAQSDLRRTEQLAERGFIAATRLDTERLAERAAKREREAAVAEHHAAIHDLEQARAAMAVVREGSASRTGGRFTVRAPSAGRVLKVVQPNEANVPAGAALIEIGDISQLEVLTELLTQDALRARIGDRTVIDHWGGPLPLEGRVSRIEPGAFTKISALGVEEQRVNVFIEITSPPAQWQSLGDGYRVGVRIVTLQVPDALRVPVSAVFPMPAGTRTSGGPGLPDDREPTMAVFTLKDHRARLTSVEIGARNGVHAWVRSGLAPGDTVIAYPPSAIRDGARVRPRSDQPLAMAARRSL